LAKAKAESGSEKLKAEISDSGWKMADGENRKS
jgi:hypothetical protein